jgi:hypothetical protein
MKYWQVIFFAFLISIISGCASVELDPSKVRAQAARDRGVSENDFIIQEPVRYGIAARGARVAEFRLGIYVQTKNELLLYRYHGKDKAATPDVAIPLSRIENAVAYTWGLFQAAQLQVVTDIGVIAVNFNNSSDAIAGNKAKTEMAVSKLHAQGVKLGQASYQLIPSDAAGMPILIPAR